LITEIYKPAILDFLCHREVQIGHYYRGITDDLLTKQGWENQSSLTLLLLIVLVVWLNKAVDLGEEGELCYT
jgi:hypothetical protein